MKVYLDDERIAPIGWVQCRWAQDVIELLQCENVTHLSLDHDLGDDSISTGYDVIKWIEQAIAFDGFAPPQIIVHSANPSAKEKMLMGIKSIIRLSNGVTK